MKTQGMRGRGPLAAGCAGLLAVHAAGPAQFAPGELTTATGALARRDAFNEAELCGTCHPAQLKDWTGSLHSRAHQDALYTAFAELARKEGGDKLYVFCASCHAPAAVATGEIPGPPGGKPTFLTQEGVTCDVCHSAQDVRRVHGEASANGALVLDDSGVRYGPLRDPATNELHRSAFSAVHTSARFCSGCHTLTHPYNGLVIENTYAEWRSGPYARAGIQCQDCHMRTVEQALTVAATLQPRATPGRACEDGPPRPDVHAHTFIGGSTGRALNGAGAWHAAAAEARLQHAAQLALHLPARAAAGATAHLAVVVTNAAAGHAIPSSITELRQVWIEVAVSAADGRVVWRNGAVRADGRVDPAATMFHTVLGDAAGQVTYRPWQAARMLSENLIPPRAAVTAAYAVPLPAGVRGPLTVRATLHYRSAPQEVLDELFGAGAFRVPVVDLTAATATLPLE